ncbi:hypothetical protein, partial [Nonomuraea aridisoli]|uniref:hypothetical protein n=1 Tax=Nonomuraea aridisoli TaxID=2070368 RepID=UPI001C64D551
TSTSGVATTTTLGSASKRTATPGSAERRHDLGSEIVHRQPTIPDPSTVPTPSTVPPKRPIRRARLLHRQWAEHAEGAARMHAPAR